jgi:hypothetical protein
MSSHFAFGLLLAATLASQPPAVEDPCLLAKRVAQSPPCFAETPCRAEELWRGAFGAPRLRPAGLTALPSDLAARLPKAGVTLGKFNGIAETFKRLGEASGVEVLLDSTARGELSGDLGAMPLEKAWRLLLSTAGLTAHLEGDRVVLCFDDLYGPLTIAHSSSRAWACAGGEVASTALKDSRIL